MTLKGKNTLVAKSSTRMKGHSVQLHVRTTVAPRTHSSFCPVLHGPL